MDLCLHHSRNSGVSPHDIQLSLENAGTGKLTVSTYCLFADQPVNGELRRTAMGARAASGRRKNS